MKLNVVPALQGAVWVRSGFRVFFKRPMAYSLLFFLYFFGLQIVVLLLRVPMELLSATIPLASLAFMVATRRALEGTPVTPGVFVEPLRERGARRNGQILLGVAYAVAMTGVFLLTDAVGREAFDRLGEALGATEVTPESLRPALADPALRRATFLFMALTAVLAVPFWHAPALVHWGRQAWARSLFFSTVACWRNRGALAVYGLTWFAVIVVFNLAAGVLFSLFGAPAFAAALAMPAGLMFAIAFYASLYFTYADCFIESSGGPSDTLELSPP